MAGPLYLPRRSVPFHPDNYVLYSVDLNSDQAAASNQTGEERKDIQSLKN